MRRVLQLSSESAFSRIQSELRKLVDVKFALCSSSTESNQYQKIYLLSSEMVEVLHYY